jgi:hypothetical protein
MLAIQYDLFQSPEESEMAALRKEVSALKISMDKQRKALFARNGELVKRMLELEDRLSVIERGLCIGNKGIF